MAIVHFNRAEMLGTKRTTEQDEMINPAQKKKIIVAAIRKAVESGNGGWIKGILPAVKADLGSMTANGDVIRNCLQSLLCVGLICRAAFDPAADDEYYVTPSTPGAR